MITPDNTVQCTSVRRSVNEVTSNPSPMCPQGPNDPDRITDGWVPPTRSNQKGDRVTASRTTGNEVPSGDSKSGNVCPYASGIVCLQTVTSNGRCKRRTGLTTHTVGRHDTGTISKVNDRTGRVMVRLKAPDSGTSIVPSLTIETYKSIAKLGSPQLR